MEDTTDEQVLDYVADMAAQLAALCGKRYPIVSALLRVAASAARERTDDAPDDCAHCQR